MKRRDFVLKSTLLSACAGIPFSMQANKLFESDLAVKNFGIQLYSIRKDMAKNPKDTLRKLASYGYKYIEGYESSLGLFWGMSNIDFKKYLDDLGIKMIASHCGETQNLESFNKKCDLAAEIGIDYLMCPGLPRKLELDIFKGHADTFNKCGQIAKNNGIKFAYHNHAYSFQKREGVYLQDVLMNNTDPSLVDFEMDIYWVVAAGEDPIEWFDKHPQRFKYCHVKDYLEIDGGKEHESCTLGQGSINFSKILSHGKKRGLETYIIEQEAYRGTTPLQAAKDNVGYMLQLKV